MRRKTMVLQNINMRLHTARNMKTRSLSLSLSRNVFSMHMEIQFNKIAKLLSDECYNAMDEPTAENESFGWLHII